MYHYVYKLANPITNEFYIGSRSCKCKPAEDTYIGSMQAWPKQPGFNKKILVKSILKDSFNSHEDKLSYELNLIKEHWNDPLNRNYSLPNSSFSNGTFTVEDCAGNRFIVKPNDPRLLDGLVIKLSTYKDKNGKISYVRIDDPKVLTGELVGINKGKKSVSNKDGKIFQVSLSDDRLKTGELVGINKGKTLTKDKCGNKLFVNSDDIRLKTGELVGITKDFFTVEDKDGNYFNVTKDDERVLNGELVATNKNRIYVEKDNEIKRIKKHELLEYELNGWKKHKLHDGKKTVYNKTTLKTKRLKPDDVKAFLLNNLDWIEGRPPGRKFIHNDELKENRYIFEKEIVNYGDDWKLGRKHYKQASTSQNVKVTVP